MGLPTPGAFPTGQDRLLVPGRRWPEGARPDGEPRSWELRRYLREVNPDNDPVRQNVEFFLGLQDRIEHRYEKVVGAVVAGKWQSRKKA